MQVCLRETIGAVVEMVAADASKKGLNIAYTMDAVLLKRAVLGDAIRIRQVGSHDLETLNNSCAHAPVLPTSSLNGASSTLPDNLGHHMASAPYHMRCSTELAIV